MINGLEAEAYFSLRTIRNTVQFWTLRALGIHRAGLGARGGIVVKFGSPLATDFPNLTGLVAIQGVIVVLVVLTCRG